MRSRIQACGSLTGSGSRCVLAKQMVRQVSLTVLLTQNFASIKDHERSESENR